MAIKYLFHNKTLFGIKVLSYQDKVLKVLQLLVKSITNRWVIAKEEKQMNKESLFFKEKFIRYIICVKTNNINPK